MKIVLDATAAVSGGKLYLEKLIEQLAKAGSPHYFVILHAGDLDHLVDSFSKCNIHFHRIDFLATLRIPVIPPGFWRMLWRKFFLSRLLDQLGADLLFSNSGFAPRQGKRRYRVLIALHNSMPLRKELIAEETSLILRMRLVWLRRMIHQSLKNCDGAIVFSSDTARTIEEQFQDIRVRPRVIYHGIDWQREPQDQSDLTSVLPGRSYLLYVSQFHRYKNLVRLVEAFASVAKESPDLTLLLIGEKADPVYWKEVQSTVNRLGISEQIVYLGSCPRERLLDIYQNALAFVHPSMAETCSFPLLEALAVGLPVAAARMSALPEIADDAALYFDPYDVRDMASVLKEVIDNEDLRQDLSARAHQRASLFSWHKTAEKTMKMIDEVGTTDSTLS